jgi:EAL domain-containing protein (putative c-di-GMP-specific phosphodiesterase class I)
MGRALNLAVVAEGIETEEQAETLRALGCDYGQGFLYARPLTRAQLDQLVEARRELKRLT